MYTLYTPHAFASPASVYGVFLRQALRARFGEGETPNSKKLYISIFRDNGGVAAACPMLERSSCCEIIKSSTAKHPFVLFVVLAYFDLTIISYLIQTQSV